MKLEHTWHTVYYSETISYKYERKQIRYNNETTSWKYEMKFIRFYICMKEFIALLKNKILPFQQIWVALCLPNEIMISHKFKLVPNMFFFANVKYMLEWRLYEYFLLLLCPMLCFKNVKFLLGTSIVCKKSLSFWDIGISGYPNITCL